MKSLALALLLAATPAVVADDLADAAKSAKAARAKRKSSTTKVITNADVKKSKGKVVEHKLPALAVEDAPAETLTEKQKRLKQESAAYVARLDAAEKAVRTLEAELTALEQKYYDENDLDRRDGELVRRFTATKKKLATARQELQTVLDAALATRPPDPVESADANP
jgi:predicted RNase H-like nuclease (RuvC/YqgF family)